MSQETNDPNSPHTFSFSSESSEISEVEYTVEQMETLLGYKIDQESISHKVSTTEKNLVTEANAVIRKNSVSGLYSGTLGTWKLDLRIDVDGKRPMSKVSGDYYSVTGGTTTYFGSFRIDSISLTTLPTVVTISGTATTTWTTAYKNAKITIPRTIFVQPRAPATIAWSNNDGQAGATYVCPFVSIYFRRVMHEMDFESGVPSPFVSYNTGSLPSGGPPRVLSISSAYKEAGIDFPQIAGDEISSTEAGVDAIWTDAELHASMVKHFSLFKELPQWAVWSIACKSQHQIGPTLLGIMFDQQGKQRQGCAVFYGGVGGTTSDKLRLQLYTHVHELGHCFNLLHSWQKSLANPPAPDRISALSWMNYPWRFPGGPGAFWNSFAFQFDDLEIVHLRHAFRNNVVMGGNPFTSGSALDFEMSSVHLFADPIIDNSGLELRLSSKPDFKLGEPVVAEIKLSTTVKNDILVDSNISPKYHAVKIGIRKPSGVIDMYEPLIDYLITPEPIVLNADKPAIYASAYIGYGKDLYFDQPGEYLVRAIYYGLDGSKVLSNVLSIKVNFPLSESDQKVANLLMGDEQGKLFYLLGSPPMVLEDGNKAFDTVLARYKDNPLAVYVQFIRGIDAGRKFKLIEKDKVKVVRERESDTSIKLLNQTVEKSKAGKGLDNISTNYAMRQVAKQYLLKQNTTKAKETMDDMVSYFSRLKLNSNVIDTIKKQAKDTLQTKKSK
jgi:hypothetical protein